MINIKRLFIFIRKVVEKGIRKVKYLLDKVFMKLDNFTLYFISGNEYLPEPLAKEEEEKLLKEYELTRSEEVKNVLIERNLRLVVYIAKKFENTGLNIEDVISIGSIGLIKAISTFKNDKNIKLATYASKCIENEILMFIRKSNKYKNEVSLDVSLNTDWDGNELLLSDTIGTDEELIFKDIERETDNNILAKIMEKLNNREREIIYLRFGLNKEEKEFTQKEVADYLGISQSYISRLEKKVMKKLKKDIVKLY